jgi:hypothetical protein
VLKDINLLEVICAIAASNFAITVDQVSTHIPRQTLTAIMENLEYNSRLLNDTVTPLSMVQHEYSRCTPINSVLTVTTMQLVTLTAAFLKAIAGFLQPATLQAITGSVTSGLYRRIDPTLMEIVRLLMMYEDTEERESLRRKYIKEQFIRPISTQSVHQALQEWIERKQAHADILHQPAYHSVPEEITALHACLPPSLRPYLSDLKKHYAITGFPVGIEQVFARLRSLSDNENLTSHGQHRNHRGDASGRASVQFAGDRPERDHTRHGRHQGSSPSQRLSRHNRRLGFHDDRHGYDHRHGHRGDHDHSRGRHDQHHRHRARDIQEQVAQPIG